jgi:hypothetical protein
MRKSGIPIAMISAFAASGAIAADAAKGTDFESWQTGRLVATITKTF